MMNARAASTRPQRTCRAVVKFEAARRRVRARVPEKYFRTTIVLPASEVRKYESTFESTSGSRATCTRTVTL
jgi:hypothetical protein